MYYHENQMIKDCLFNLGSPMELIPYKIKSEHEADIADFRVSRHTQFLFPNQHSRDPWYNKFYSTIVIFIA